MQTAKALPHMYMYMYILIVLSRHKHHQGYKLTETLRFQRDKHLVNTRLQRESVPLTMLHKRWGSLAIHNVVACKPSNSQARAGDNNVKKRLVRLRRYLGNGAHEKFIELSTRQTCKKAPLPAHYTVFRGIHPLSVVLE